MMLPNSILPRALRESVVALAFLFGLLVVSNGACVSANRPARLAFENVATVDAVNGLREEQRVVTQGDEIIWVGDMGEGGPSAPRTIDAGGRFLIPGLWDAHVHFLYDPELTDAMAALFLRYGITSVRDTGGDLEKLVSLRTSWREDDVAAPRLYFAGPLLDGAHVVYDGATPAQPALGTRVPDPETAREKVRWLHSRGADLIKIYELVSPEVFEALVGEARKLDMPIASHVPLSLAADVAGPQADSMEHLRNVELACASNWEALLAERRERIQAFEVGRGFELRRGLHSSQRLTAIANYDADRCRGVLSSLRSTLQVPTLRLNAFNRSRPDLTKEWQAALAELPASVEARWREKAAEIEPRDGSLDLTFADWSLFLVGEMKDQGVPVGAGTDTPIRLAIPGESLHRELELLVESGLSPREALYAATIAPARFFSLEHEMGTIEVGKRADLVLLEANPLIDIRHTRRIRGVLARGVWRPRSGSESESP